jgi:CHAD domain-containing protein
MTGRRLDVDASFRLPDLARHLPKHGRVLTRAAEVTHVDAYDTPDGRLARAGVSFVHRPERLDAWTVTLPIPGRSATREVSAPDHALPPTALVALVTAFTRGAPVVATTRTATTRVRIELRDRDDALLAELTDERVAVEGGRRPECRSVTLIAHHASPKQLHGLTTDLRAKGAVFAHPETPPKRPKPPKAPKTGARPVIAAALRRDIGDIVGFDSLVRLRATLPDGDTAVHRMRAGVRRLRADLATYAPMLADAWVRPLRGELAWLGDALGAARDAEVLRARLRRTAAADPLDPLDPIAIARIDADLAARAEDARVAVTDTLTSGRYRALLGTLDAVATDPPLHPKHPGDPRRPVAKVWRRVDARADLDPMADDGAWHAARIRARRARYAVESLDPRAELALALAATTSLLGAHSDAVVAGRTWREIADSDPDDHVLAVTAGRLYERERAVVADVRGAYPPLWAAIRRAKLAEWLT